VDRTKTKELCVTKDRVPLRGSAVRLAPALFVYSPLRHRALAHPVPAPPQGEPRTRALVSAEYVVRHSYKTFALPRSFQLFTGVNLALPAGARTATAASGRNREL